MKMERNTAPHPIERLAMFGAALAFALFSGCAGGSDRPAAESGAGGDGGGLTTGPGTATSTDPCAQWANAVCAKQASCSPFFFALSYGDLATCNSALVSGCEVSLGLDGVSATQADVSACASALQMQSCSDNSPLPACGSLGHGTRPTGTPCTSAWQCESGSCGDRDATGCGTCSQALGTGQYCDSEPSAFCGDGLHCSVAGSCEPDREKGQSCESDVDCAYSLACVSGTCGDALSQGAACDGYGCNFAQGFMCGLQSNVCEPMGLAGPGESCGMDASSNIFTFCRAGGSCNYDLGVCEPDAELGQSCNVASVPASFCVPGAYCVAGTCASTSPVCG